MCYWECAVHSNHTKPSPITVYVVVDVFPPHHHHHHLHFLHNFSRQIEWNISHIVLGVFFCVCVSCHIELESLELQSRAHTLICVYVFIYRKSTSPWTERCSISYFSKISRLLLRTCALYTKRFIYNTLAHQHNLRRFVARYSCSRRCRCYCGKLDNHFLLSWCSLRADFVGCFVVVYSIYVLVHSQCIDSFTVIHFPLIFRSFIVIIMSCLDTQSYFSLTFFSFQQLFSIRFHFFGAKMLYFEMIDFHLISNYFPFFLWVPSFFKWNKKRELD